MTCKWSALAPFLSKCSLSSAVFVLVPPEVDLEGKIHVFIWEVKVILVDEWETEIGKGRQSIKCRL